jgi:CRISPR-associated protein Cas5t
MSRRNNDDLRLFQSSIRRFQALLLGLAGVDRSRKRHFAGARIALGLKHLPRRGRLYQQLHVIPQSKPQKEGEFERRKELSKGRKLSIRTFWKEVLYNLEGYIGLDHPELERMVSQGINQPSLVSYWGLPFLGDNNFFAERIDVIEQPPPCHWLCPLRQSESLQGGRLFYLSVWSDYENSLHSDSRLFLLTSQKESVPDEAWVIIQEKP